MHFTTDFCTTIKSKYEQGNESLGDWVGYGRGREASSMEKGSSLSDVVAATKKLILLIDFFIMEDHRGCRVISFSRPQHLCDDVCVTRSILVKNTTLQGPPPVSGVVFATPRVGDR